MQAALGDLLCGAEATIVVADGVEASISKSKPVTK
jgi:hypothetical protein